MPFIPGPEVNGFPIEACWLGTDLGPTTRI